MSERRQYQRFRVDVLDIKSTMLLVSNVHILDISLGGVLLKADTRLNIANKYILKMERNGKVLNIRGTIVWSQLSESKKNINGEIVPIYTAGMQFTTMSKGKWSELVDFIEKHKLEEDEQLDVHRTDGLRLHARVRIDDPQIAIVNSQETYNVMTLSMGGMQIKGKQHIEVENLLPFELQLPQEKTVKVFAKIVSCKQELYED